MLADYRDFLSADDELADGPTVRILESAARDKEEQIAALRPGRDDAGWPEQLRQGLASLERPTGTPFSIRTSPPATRPIFRRAPTGRTCSIPTTRTATASGSSSGPPSAT